MSRLLDVNELLSEAESTPPAVIHLTACPALPLKPTVLIATRSEGTLKSIAIALESVGYRTHSASDAYVAAEWLQRFPEIGLIIVDRRLSEFDGFQVCKMIREADDAAPPVIILSRKMGLWSRMKARAVGAAGLIPKPICPDDLIAAVRKKLPMPKC